MYAQMFIPLFIVLGITITAYCVDMSKLSPVARNVQTGLFVLTLTLIPAFSLVLWQQSGAIDRLEATGVAAHPGLAAVVGLGYGSASRPFWLFESDASFEEIAAFYQQQSNRRGWVLLERKDALILHRARERMAIMPGDKPGQIAYALNTLNAGPNTVLADRRESPELTRRTAN